jgi:hypothetical protein
MFERNKYYYKDGTTSIYKYRDKILHRIDGPARECSDGSKEWWVDGKLHKVDGPAVEFTHAGKHWYIDGKRHRIDGPAAELASGTKMWYIDGMNYSEQDFNETIEQVNEMNLAMKLTDPRWWVRELGEKELYEQGK